MLGVAAAVAVALVMATRQASGDHADSLASARPKKVRTAPPPAATTVVAPQSQQEIRQRTRVRRRLQEAVADAGDLGGVATAAIMLNGWRAPVVASSVAGGTSATMRMWSTSKVATAAGVLRDLGWGDAPGQSPSAELLTALNGALRRSENCRQRRVVLALQRAAGSPTAAAGEIKGLFAIAGAHPLIARRTQGPDAICSTYLGTQREINDPAAPALMLGTSRWRMSDAVRFAYAVGAGDFGAALTRRLLELMRAPKLRSREAPSTDYTAALDWGAGKVLRCAKPAYKAGWGGAQNQTFIAEQIAVVGSGRHTAAIAVAFAPKNQPPIDDPGRTSAPAAIELVMSRMARDLTGARCGGTR